MSAKDSFTMTCKKMEDSHCENIDPDLKNFCSRVSKELQKNVKKPEIAECDTTINVRSIASPKPCDRPMTEADLDKDPAPRPKAIR